MLEQFQKRPAVMKRSENVTPVAALKQAGKGGEGGPENCITMMAK